MLSVFCGSLFVAKIVTASEGIKSQNQRNADQMQMQCRKKPSEDA